MSHRDLPPELAVSAAAVGRMIRLSREARGWSLAELARRAGSPRPRLARLERAERRPSWWTLARVACAFFPDDDVLALRAAHRLAAAAGPALDTVPPTHEVGADDRAFRLAYPQGIKSVVAWTSSHHTRNHGGS